MRVAWSAVGRRRVATTVTCFGLAVLLTGAAWADDAGPSSPAPVGDLTAPDDDAGPALLPAPEPEPEPPPVPAPVASLAPPARPQEARAEGPRPNARDKGALAGARLIVGIERAFGLAYWRSTLTAAPPPPMGDIRISWARETSSGHLTSLLGASATYGELGEVAAPSLMPRVAADAVIFDRFTVGGALGYFSSAGSRVATESSGDSSTANDPARAGLLLAPRAGFLLALGPHVTLWLRAGITFASTTVKQVDETAALITRDYRHLDASLDPALLISPFPHLGVLVNPFADLGLGGRRRVSVVDAGGSRGENQAAYRWSGYGLSVALCGFF